MTNLLDRIEDKVSLLPEGLQNHIQRTRIKAKEISNIHGIDEIKCELGVLSHDLARHFNKEHLEDESKRLQIETSEIEKKEPLLLHGPIAAVWLKDYYGCTDEDVIAAVHHHTTGRPYMSDIEKVVFISDKIEPGKVSKNPKLKPVADTALSNLDEAISQYLSLRIINILESGGLVHPAALDTWNWINLSR